MTITGLRCDHVVELASDFLEQALPPAERVALEQHLLICADCERYVSQLRSVVALAGEERAADVATPREAALLAMFRALKRGAP